MGTRGQVGVMPLAASWNKISGDVIIMTPLVTHLENAKQNSYYSAESHSSLGYFGSFRTHLKIHHTLLIYIFIFIKINPNLSCCSIYI